jgi:hypothetical protein
MKNKFFLTTISMYIFAQASYSGVASANGNNQNNTDKTYKCYFTNFSNPKGNHKENLNFTFITNGSDTAYVKGNFSKQEVVYIDKGNGKTFVEVTNMGNVMVTTIDKNMKAVHSRNSVGILGKLIPSQFYGTCEIK